MIWEPSHWIEEEIVRLRRLLREHEEGYLAGTPTLSPADYDRHLAMQKWLTHVYQTFSFLDCPMNDDYQDWYGDKLDATAITCSDCGDTTYFEFENCHHCGWDLNQEPEGEDDDNA